MAFTDRAPLKQNTNMTQSAVPEAGAAAAPDDAAEVLVFEQPLNERMRTFLRLDFLYNQALYHNEMASPWGSRAAMSSLIDILAITTRGDVRSDVLKELESQLTSLNEFQSSPGVDAQRLKTLMSNLLRLRADLMAAGSTFLQPLRDSEFVNSIRHRSAIPGGTCEFDLPDYTFWLTQSDDARMRTFNQWLGLLRPMCDAIAELLWLTRQNGRSREEMARAAPSTSLSSATIHCSCCASRCRHPRACTPRSAAVTTAAISASSPGTAWRPGRHKRRRTCRSC